MDLGTGSHKLSFKIVEVSLGSHGAGGGGGAGKVKFHDITITKKVEPSSPALSLSRGEHFKKAVIVCRKAGEKPLEYFTIKLSDANVSAVQTQPASGDEGPTERITFVYGQVKVEYQPQNP